MENDDTFDSADEFEAEVAPETYQDKPKEVDPRLAARVMDKANEDGTYRKLIQARKSAFVHHLIHLNGHKFDFTGRQYLFPIYDSKDQNILLKTSRQVEKTTFLGNNLIISSVVKPYNKSLYVSPSHQQTRQFSNEKLKAAIEQSPFIQKYFQDSSVSSQVFEKGFTNGSYIFLRSAFRSADRTRGISARNLFLDELQDMLISEIPVIMECTSHFPDYQIMMAGTPKTYDNVIEVYWQNTTQNEWLVKCGACNHYNFLDETNIAKTELYLSKSLPPGCVCKKCAKPIDTSKGSWYSFSAGKTTKGYRVPQLMVPWIVGLDSQWQKLLWKRDNYPAGQFANEVLGLSYDNASKPVTRDELIACCDGNAKLLRDPPDPMEMEHMKRFQLVAGIDWGEGNDGSERSPTGKIRHASYTVLTLGTYIDQKRFKVFFVKKYTGAQANPDFVMKDVTRICAAFGVQLIGADWGHGWGMNNQLVRHFGLNRVVQLQYLPKMKERAKYDPIGAKYMLQRNLIISEMFYAIKQKEIIFPAWKEIEPYAKDILAVYSEYVEYQRQMKYDHRPSDPDDFLHSLIYCKQAADLFFGRRWQS